MSGAVCEARGWANALVQRESRGPGDTENAMRRLEARYGVPFSTLWILRYRPPKDIYVGVYERLKAAYLAETEKQIKALQHDAELVRAATQAAENNARKDHS